MSKYIKRLVLRAALLAACFLPGVSAATDFTDIWFNPQESGWGVNIVQTDNFMFATFFIYGPDNRPTWYTALLNFDGTSFSGNLYLTQGTFWAFPWNPADHPPAQQVGTASFTPSVANAFQATLAYTVFGTGSVVKNVVRQTLTAITIAGNYLGGQVGGYAGCTDSSQNANYTDTYTLAVTQTANSATFVFTYHSGATCTLTGATNQQGLLYDMPSVGYSCTGSLSFSTNAATLFEVRATPYGIEGRLSANLPGGCQENATFSGTLM